MTDERGHHEAINVFHTSQGWVWSVWGPVGGAQGIAKSEQQAWDAARRALQGVGRAVARP